MFAAAPVVRVVGDALLDVHAVPNAAPRAGADVPAGIRLAPGGQGANLAVRLARAGIPVELISALGPDPAGAILRRALTEEGVGLREVPVAATGVVVVLRDASGERTMLSQRVAFAAEAAAALDRIDGWVVVSGYLLDEPGADGLADVLARARRRAVVGCALATGTLAAWRARVQRIGPHLLVLNAEEQRQLGELDLDGGVMVSTGHDVVLARAGGSTLRVEVPRTDGSVVDTTGAGDAFAAALVAGLLDAPWPPDERTLRGALAGAARLAARVARVDGAQRRVAGERAATVTP